MIYSFLNAPTHIMSFIFHNDPVRQVLLLLYQMKKVRVWDSKKPAHSKQLVGSKAKTWM